MKLTVQHPTSDTEKVASLLSKKVTDCEVSVKNYKGGISRTTFENRYEGYTSDAERAMWVAENRMGCKIVEK
jgi:hypothetical protein